MSALTGSLATQDDSKIIDIMPYIERQKKENQKKKKSDYQKENVPDLAEIADVLVQLTLILDSLGYFNYADKIADVVGEMFEDESLNATEEDSSFDE